MSVDSLASSSISHNDRMQQEIDRIVSQLELKNPSSSYDDNLQKAEEIYERQETRRIRLEAERMRASNSALASLPTLPSQTIGSTQIGI
jgi:exonuclease VII small subunit